MPSNGSTSGTTTTSVVSFRGNRPRSIALSDLNGDGTLDLVTADSASRTVSVALNAGAASFDPPFTLPVTWAPWAVALEDLDGNGTLDIVVAAPGSPHVSVFLNDGQAAFAPELIFDVGRGMAIDVGDLDHDGDTDVAVVNSETRSLLQIGLNLSETAPLVVTDCNANGVPDECEIATSDCNENGIPDDCDIAAETSGDCNGNGTPDECDIAAGTSADCNTNGRPDECDPDCNGNSVADDCEITEGTTDDMNRNGVPDECETLGDTDGDGDVDLADLLVVQTCLHGSDVPITSACAAADLDGDGDGDLADFLIWQTFYTGPLAEVEGPTADAGPDREVRDSQSPVVVTLDGSASQAGDSPIDRYAWFEGGVVLGEGAIIDAPLAFGTHVITLRVTDTRGLFDIDTVTIEVKEGGVRGR